MLAAIASGLVAAGTDEGLTRKQADELLIELRRVRQLLERQCYQAEADVRSRVVSVDASSSPALGSKDAPIAIVEYSDYECPFCQQFFQQTFEDLKRQYVDSGKVRFFVMDFPLEKHRNAMLAAESAQCANEQGAFWAMHDKMQANPEKLAIADLLDYANQSGLDVASFHSCINESRYRKKIQEVVRTAEDQGVHGTPSFVVGRKTSNDIVQGKITVGANSLVGFREILDSLEREIAGQPPSGGDKPAPPPR